MDVRIQDRVEEEKHPEMHILKTSVFREGVISADFICKVCQFGYIFVDVLIVCKLYLACFHSFTL